MDHAVRTHDVHMLHQQVVHARIPPRPGLEGNYQGGAVDGGQGATVVKRLESDLPWHDVGHQDSLHVSPPCEVLVPEIPQRRVQRRRRRDEDRELLLGVREARRRLGRRCPEQAPEAAQAGLLVARVQDGLRARGRGLDLHDGALQASEAPGHPRALHLEGQVPHGVHENGVVRVDDDICDGHQLAVLTRVGLASLGRVDQAHGAAHVAIAPATPHPKAEVDILVLFDHELNLLPVSGSRPVGPAEDEQGHGVCGPRVLTEVLHAVRPDALRQGLRAASDALHLDRFDPWEVLHNVSVGIQLRAIVLVP
mmetsp:Transcript_143402/g.357284  ORF Transcript_143402/g.357284 Transcript_143402/m.357284 type:complete len:309 (+) Transcript_143402:214-1140(+)